MKTLFNDKETEIIREAVRRAERHSACQIVPVVVLASDDHDGALWRITISVSLAASFAFFALFPHLGPLWGLGVEVAGLCLGFALGCVPGLRRLALHRQRTDAEVRRRAIQAFFEHRVDRTRHRTGILIFVSLFERRAQILCDEGISAKVHEGTWKSLVDELAAGAGAGRLADALAKAIDDAGALVSKHFPHEVGEKNELADDVIVRES